MKKTVLFLGAGVSKTFGYPLTSEILPLIIKKLLREQLFKEVTRERKVASLYRKLVANLLIYLSPGLGPLVNGQVELQYYKGGLPFVTELLSQLDHFIVSGQSIADWNFEVDDPLLRPTKVSERWELTDLKTLFEWAIILVINSPVKTDSKVLSRFLTHLNSKNRGGRDFYSIISTNYDVALEWELLDWGQAWNADLEIDFGCSWRDPVEEKDVVYLRPAKPIYRIFKLHGSTDWLKCERCGFLYINPTEDIFELTFPNAKRDYNSCHCGYWPLKPVLITPSFVRQINDSNLQEIWRNALEELRTADEWLIVGYSLPSEDFDIKSLFLRALAGREKKPLINVVQRTGRTKGRFDLFFGEDNYTYFEGGLEKYIGDHFLNSTGKRKKERVTQRKTTNPGSKK